MYLKSQRHSIRRVAIFDVVLAVVGALEAVLTVLQLAESNWLWVPQAVAAIMFYGTGLVLIRRWRRLLAQFEAEHGIDAGKQ